MFITFEGIDGCGKSTQIRLLAKELENHGREVLILREPGGTDFSEKIREILLNSKFNFSPVVELLLFEAARSHLVENVIKPALAKGKVVLSDRFYDSTTAYQGFGRGVNIPDVLHCNRIAIDGVHPDITFFLEIPLGLAQKRSRKRKLDKIEISGDDFYSKVNEGYNNIHYKEPNRFFKIDASGSIRNTHELIKKKYYEFISS